MSLSVSLNVHVCCVQCDVHRHIYIIIHIYIYIKDPVHLSKVVLGRLGSSLGSALGKTVALQLSLGWSPDSV